MDTTKDYEAIVEGWDWTEVLGDGSHESLDAELARIREIAHEPDRVVHLNNVLGPAVAEACDADPTLDAAELNVAARAHATGLAGWVR